jgi:ubiquitin-conjugating enzyme E2 variant
VLLTVGLLGREAPLTNLFFTLFTNFWMLSQEFHKYSHMRTVPPAVKILQDAGVILSRAEHGRHHSAPFEGHYCILTGICNPLLDRIKFFRYLENAVYKLTGNKPNTWLLDPTLQQDI